MTASMTGFARAEGADMGLGWAWELRSVNGRGLELRLKLPSGLERLEAPLREIAGRVIRRGNVTANLTLRRDEAARPVVDAAALDAILALVADLAVRLPASPPPRLEAVLALPGVLRSGPPPAETGTEDVHAAAVQAGFAQALALLAASRGEEGARLAVVLDGLLDEIEALRLAAVTDAADQPARVCARVMETVGSLLQELPALPHERVAQEVAILAARADVREELDRLGIHVAAARALLAEDAAVGRRLEFLVQEFHREANTLCSKSASAALTATGLRLKAAIEQLREQVANIE